MTCGRLNELCCVKNRCSCSNLTCNEGICIDDMSLATYFGRSNNWLTASDPYTCKTYKDTQLRGIKSDIIGVTPSYGSIYGLRPELEPMICDRSNEEMGHVPFSL